jgi:hypothetical protein
VAQASAQSTRLQNAQTGNPKENKMAFMKHVGKHGDRKVCILFRQVPGEDHMALIIYPEVLPAHWQDSIQKP